MNEIKCGLDDKRIREIAHEIRSSISTARAMQIATDRVEELVRQAAIEGYKLGKQEAALDAMVAENQRLGLYDS